jgi:hypothetical protein
MQEHRAATPRYARSGIVIDLDNEVIEAVFAPEPVATAAALQPDRPVVMPVVRVFAPGVLRADGADRQEGPRPLVTVAPPPEPQGVKDAPGRAAIALALVGPDAAPAERDGYRPPAGR